MDHELGKIELPLMEPTPISALDKLYSEETYRYRIAALEVQVAELQREMRNLNPGWLPK